MKSFLRISNVFCYCPKSCQRYRNFCTQNLPDKKKVFSHTPVMVNEVLEALNVKNNGVYLDMTFGAGGHAKHILREANIKLFCLDRDPVAYNLAQRLAETEKDKVVPLLGKFSELENVMEEAGVSKNSIDGVLIDAGCSSMQLDDSSRGFSFIRDGPLDMRMDGNRNPDMPTAADVINNLNPHDLAKIIKKYGEEKRGKVIAQGLFDFRHQIKDITSTLELANLVASIVGGERRADKLQRPVHLATKVFQAIRIFVNDELNELNCGIDLAHSYLKPGGKLVALTFHSLEDRIVKRQMLGIDMNEALSGSLSQKYKNALNWHSLEEVENIYSNKWAPMYKSVVTPTNDEVLENPRSRSAKLRACVKQ